MAKAQAVENTNYELHTLGWKSFQDLCSTIFSELWGQDFQTFSPTHDEGRDGYFVGTWQENKAVKLTGTFTVQCKFTNDPKTKMTLSLLNDELKKAKKLALEGLCENYILVFNHSISGPNLTLVTNAFKSISGIKEVRVFGGEWLTQQIRNSATLRMLVPRIYGLGDLSYIIDERARKQAKEILRSMEEDLSKFVKTKAYRDSAKALSKKKVLVLLGQAASGKSTIAATLSLVALDQWKSPPFFIRDPSKFEEHWNPDDSNQVFWVDDAFGSTSYKKERVDEWNCVLKHMKAALNKGARFIFTSRDYIYRDAIRHLKVADFPLFEDAQVVIRLDELTLDEKKQILYNHIKQGDQPVEYRKSIQPFLDEIAENEKFLPEIARRLGHKIFTKGLSINSSSLKNYIEHPTEFLMLLLNEIDKESRAAIALIFMNEGKLKSPINFNDEEQKAIIRLGATQSGVIDALNNLEESLTKKVFQDESFYWTFKHPTIADAYSEILISNPELLNIYLRGSKPENMISEIVCGEVNIKGAKVVIPKELYPDLTMRLNELHVLPETGYISSPLCSFLAQRCSQNFLEYYLKQRPEILDVVKRYGHTVYSGIGAIAVKLHKMKILDDSIRREITSRLTHNAIQNMDPTFQKSSLSSLYTDEEMDKIFQDIKSETLPYYEAILEGLMDSFDPHYDSIDGYFDDAERFLRLVSDELEYSEEDKETNSLIEESYELIESYKSELNRKYEGLGTQEGEIHIGKSDTKAEITNVNSRSIFSDIAN